ncbi:MAG: hypothetical protein IKP62_09155 [Salinivirgaceae bacterium]|nr:hypothetical protein [Salinivirgaceae bacterium]
MNKCTFILKTTFPVLVFSATLTTASAQSLLAEGEQKTIDFALCYVYDNESHAQETMPIKKWQSINNEVYTALNVPSNTSETNQHLNNLKSPTYPPIYRDVAYRDVFMYSNRTFEVCFCGGALGLNSKKALGCGGVSMSLYGFYFDCLCKPLFHGSSTGVEKWDDSFGFTLHAGYQIPIVDWLRIIPEIGYFSVSEGTTDGSKYSVDKDGIHNKYTADWKDKGLDYGAVMVLHFFDCFNIDFAVTRNTMYGGLGFGIHF